MGKRGQSLKNETGVGRFIAQPAMSLFAVEQRMVFQVQIPQALDLYKASNGRLPKSHDEFMTQIIKANNIRLPELPPGKFTSSIPTMVSCTCIRLANRWLRFAQTMPFAYPDGTRFSAIPD